MAHQSDPRFLALHGSKLKGFAETPGIAALVGLKAKQVDTELAGLVKGGFVMHREGRISGWMLTPAGRIEHDALLATDLAAMGNLAELQRCYDEFLEWNRELLEVCTAWQVKDLERNVMNDHTDKAHDTVVVKRLQAVHEGLAPISVRLSAMATRFDPYGTRLKFALDKVKRGSTDWFAKPLIDSYHTVWMELHEDLLAGMHVTGLVDS